jgi:hypothetical protein
MKTDWTIGRDLGFEMKIIYPTMPSQAEQLIQAEAWAKLFSPIHTIIYDLCTVSIFLDIHEELNEN